MFNKQFLPLKFSDFLLFFLKMNQQNTYEQHHEYAQQSYQPANTVPLPNNFLETDEPQQDQVLQQRIISGEYAPEPAEYCNVSNEAVYGGGENVYDSYSQGNMSHQYHHQYQQMPSYGQQYDQMGDPWLDVQQHEPNVYGQEDFDPSMNEQYIYPNDQQPTSSVPQQVINNNPFEEEGDDEEEEAYEPMPVTVRIQPMRLIGQPPRQPVRQSLEEYDPEQGMNAPQRGKDHPLVSNCINCISVIRRPANDSSPPEQKAPERKLRYARKIQPAPRRDYEDFFM